MVNLSYLQGDKCLKNLDLRKENFIDPGEWIPPKKKGENR